MPLTTPRSDQHLLIVEDDLAVARLMRRALEDSGFVTELATDVSAAREALKAAPERGFDAVLLDLQLPDDSGLALLRALRNEQPELPVLIVTGQRTDSDIVEGLDAGADDYLVKPFAVSVLVARVRAVLRRGAATGAESVRIGELRFDRLKREISTPDGSLSLTPKEYTLLEYFLLRPEQVVTRSALLENVWGMQFDPGSNLVDVHMARLRRKLQERARTPVLRTVRGKGFQLTEHAEAGADASVDENADANA